MFSDIVMSSKTVSNKSGFWALIAIFVGQGILVGLIVIVLGLTKALDPFALTRMNMIGNRRRSTHCFRHHRRYHNPPMACSNHQGPD